MHRALKQHMWLHSGGMLHAGIQYLPGDFALPYRLG